MDKKEVAGLLEAGDEQALAGLAERDPQALLRRLIGLAYDKADLICWRAIEAVGRVSGLINRSRPDIARNLAQRLLWMMRDESGNNPGSAPEMLGEIVLNSPDAFADIAPIIGSFEDEAMLRKGVLRALWRVAGRRADLVNVDETAVRGYLEDPDPEVRAYAILLAVEKKLKTLKPDVERLLHDTAEAVWYDQGAFRCRRLGDLAAEATARLGEME
ncbi:MAG: hypothetical protein OHK006_19680 [Thermodesulfovibrionales bacterium]